VSALFSASAAQKQVTLEELWDDPFPERVMLDPFRLRQILGNLLSNAIKFTPPGQGITVRAFYDEAKEVVVFSVIDEGPGIDEKWQERIFDAFLQVRGSDASLHGGTGLGLPISRALARRMGGDITVRSRTGEGSTFSVSLPAQKQSAPALQGPDTASFQANGAKVLVVEDQPDNQLLIRLLMERMGFVVRMADNGEEALETLQWGRFDLALIDENMPGISGTETMRRMRQRGIQTPMVALTANAIKGDRERFIKAGFDDYLSKPIRKEQLIKTVAALLQ
jgi:CheY-like chemotaxis protein